MLRIPVPARNYVELVEKTLRVLEALSDKPDTGHQLKTLAARAGLVKSSAFRILYTLKELGYVDQSADDGNYRSTPKVLCLAGSAAARPDLKTIARPYLARMRAGLRETASIAEWHDGAVVIVEVAHAPHPLQLSLDVGDSCPLHASALGKAVAAHLPHLSLESALGKGKLPRYTRHTITSRARLALELAEVRRRGYATNDEETVDGVVLVGAPVFDADGRVAGAVSVSSPTARCSPEKRRAMVDAVTRTAAAITKDLERVGHVAAANAGSF